MVNRLMTTVNRFCPSSMFRVQSSTFNAQRSELNKKYVPNNCNNIPGTPILKS